MAKYNVRTTAVIDNNPVGSTIVLPKKTAESLADKGYAVILSEVKAETKPKKAPAKKAKSAPKKPAKETAKKDTKKTDDK